MPTHHTHDTPTSLRAVGAGLLAGLVWSVVEAVSVQVEVGWLSLATASWIVGLDVAMGLVAGLLLVPLSAVIRRPAAQALALTVIYGFVRIAGPPTPYAEVGYLAAAALVAWIGTQLVEDDDQYLVVLAHVLILATAAVAIAKVGVGHVQSTRFAREEPSSFDLLAILIASPIIALVADRMLALAIPWRGVRLGTQLVTLAALAALTARWVPTRPLLDTTAQAGAAPGGAPDVVVVVLDTTRADHLSTYGYHRETSPNLTALANDGLNFPAARSTAQWTVPGHASLFTGLYPSRHGAHYVGQWQRGQPTDRQHRAFPLAEHHTTLAEILRSHGWATAAFVANFANLHRGLGMAQGFSYYDDAPGSILWPTPHAVRFLRQIRPSSKRATVRSAQSMSVVAQAWIDRTASDRPAFVFLNFMEPHFWLAEPPYDRWAREVPGWKRIAQRSLFSHQIPHVLDKQEIDFAVASYDGQLAAMDAALGDLIAGLKARGRYENTLIVVTADHGELLGEHGLLGHGGRMMYEGLLDIPMVVKLPGADRRRGVISTPVQQVDVLPTVLKTLGLPVPEACQGENVQRVLRPAIAEEHVNPEFVDHFGDVYDRAMRVVYDGTYKLIATSRGERLLFDLSRDPGEADNLAQREPARLITMERQLESAFGTPTLAAR